MGMNQKTPVWNGTEKDHVSSYTDLANVVEKIYKLVQYQDGVLQQISKDNKNTRAMMTDFINYIKSGVPVPVIPMNSPAENNGVDIDRDYSRSSNDSGFSFANGSSEELSPSSDSKLMSDEEMEPIVGETTFALNRLADIASKEYSGPPYDEQRVLENDHDMDNLETPKVLTGLEKNTRTSTNDFNAGKIATLGQVEVSPTNVLLNEQACSSMYGYYTNPDQGSNSMPRIITDNVAEPFAGDGSNSNGMMVLPNSDFSCNPMSLYPGTQNEQAVIFPADGQTNNGSTEYYMCSYCCKTFGDHHSLELHSKGCTSKTEKSAVILNGTEDSISVEESHNPNPNAQSLVPKNRKQKRAIPCRYCERTFPTQHQVNSHERVHTGARPFACHVDKCDCKFAHGGNMIKHIKNKHPKANPYRCHNCSLSFKTYLDIQLHRKDCNSKDVLPIDRIAANKELPTAAISKIRKSPRSRKQKCYISVYVDRTTKDLGEDTDSASEIEEQQAMPTPFAICNPTPTAQSINFNFSKLETETKPSMNSGPYNSTSHSGYGWRNDAGYFRTPESSFMEHDANELLEYSNFNKTQFKTESSSDFDSVTGSFMQDTTPRSASESNRIDLSKVKIEMVD